MVIKRKSRRKRKSRKLRKSRTRVSKRNSKRRVSKKKGSYRRRSRKKSKQKKSVRSRSKKKLKGVSRVRRSKGSKPVPFAMRGGAAKYMQNTINTDTLAELIAARVGSTVTENCKNSMTSIIQEAKKRTAEVIDAIAHHLLEVKVPSGVVPGQMLQIKNPHTMQTLQVQVPEGHYAGAIFHVQQAPLR